MVAELATWGETDMLKLAADEVRNCPQKINLCMNFETWMNFHTYLFLLSIHQMNVQFLNFHKPYLNLM